MAADAQFFLNMAFTIAGVLAGWIIHALWDAQREMRDDLKKIEQNLPEIYVRRDDFKEFSRDIREMFNKIIDKLEQKMDKPN